MALDVLIMPTPPPASQGGVITVYFTATVNDAAIPQITFAMAYQYGTTQAAKVTAIKQRAYGAYVDYCTPRGITPIPANQMNAEVVGVT